MIWPLGVKLNALSTVPTGAAALVTETGPVVAPEGTVAWSWVEETYLTFDAATPWNLTAEPVLKPTPLIVTTVPASPVSGVAPVIERLGVNVWLLVALPAGVVTSIRAGTAPSGTTTRSWVDDRTVADAASTPSPAATATNFALVPATKPEPVTVTLVPVGAVVGVKLLIVSGAANT